MSSKLSNSVAYPESGKELWKIGGGEASSQPESIPHRGSSGLEEVSRPDHWTLEYLVETLGGFGIAHNVEPNPSLPGSIRNSTRWNRIPPLLLPPRRAPPRPKTSQKYSSWMQKGKEMKKSSKRKKELGKKETRKHKDFATAGWWEMIEKPWRIKYDLVRGLNSTRDQDLGGMPALIILMWG